MIPLQKSLLPLLAILAGALFSCHPASKEEPALFELMTNTGIDFSNTVRNQPDFNILTYRNFYNGGGVAIGDINNDGLPDIFFTSNMGQNKLYLNKGNMQFTDISTSAGFTPVKQQWSTGVVMADVNGDGWLDIYVCNAGNMNNPTLRKNQLFINDHHLGFIDSASQYGLADSGYSTQASFFDYDGDGDLDCFIINNSPIPVNTLDYANKRDLQANDWSISDSLKGGGDHLYRNDNGHFTEVTKQAGIHGSLISLGLGVTVGDINGDGLPDIYVSNDFFERDYLYINQGNGTFKDEMEDRIQHTSLASMGADMADINNDGYPDIFTTDMLPDDDYRLKTTFAFENFDVYHLKQRSGFYHQFFQNALQVNTGNGKFMETAHYSGVAATDWSWGSLLFDMDNDGKNDIYVCNGISQDLIDQDFLEFFAGSMMQEVRSSGQKDKLYSVLDKMPSHPLINKAFRNRGDLRFTEASAGWGFTQPSFSNGAAYADLDNDGDIDLVVNNENGPAFIYRNKARQLNNNHYIGILLKDEYPNTFAIGSKIRVYKDNQVFYREVIPSRGFQSSVDYKQIIGLGALTNIDSLSVTWPGGHNTTLLHPAVDSVYHLYGPGQQPDSQRPGQQSGGPEPGGQLPNTRRNPRLPDPAPTPLLLPLPATSFDRHEEDDNVDFNYERNLPKMLSREGPRVAQGDVNGDGLTDLYIGGTSRHPGQLYLQTPTGFIKSRQPAFDPFADFEDVAVLLFDADHDGDLDLFIGPGGNNNLPYSRQMQLRLFLNDGHGHFTLAPDAFPPTNNGVNTGVAITGDFNNDGYPDLFIGGHSIPREYGSLPSSFLYINDGKGHFTDMAPAKNPDIAHIGMVTSASWTDLTGEGRPQLLIAGEWMAPRLFDFKTDHFVEIPTNLQHLSGWWQTVTIADLNGDGRPDLILGNIGENFYLNPDAARPVKLWVEDFDNNGIKDKVLTRTIDGRDLPVFLKHDMEAQLPSLKKQNLKNASFARKSIQELFPAGLLDSAEVRLFNYTSSIVALNLGNGQFSIHRLPTSVQLSSVNAARCFDLNGDGFPDLVLGGNEYGFLPQFGRLDASFGQVLLGNGKGDFSPLPPEKSGLDLTGQVRDIAIIPAKESVYLLFLRNDENPALYSITTAHKKVARPDKNKY
ncbi:MAG TPA: VCBS repeat-containing protein [Puia sp.]|nr:VCBS repeat-containing protein [Puia sp.]